MPGEAQRLQAEQQSIGNEEAGATGSRRKPPLTMVRKPGIVLSDELFQLRLARGPRGHVKGGVPSDRVLFLYNRPGSKRGMCLYCEQEEKGLERARFISAAGHLTSNSLMALEGWIANRRPAAKLELLRAERPRVDLLAEAKRLAACAPAEYQIEIGPAARRLGQDPSILDLIVKAVRRRGDLPPAPRFMRWVPGSGGRPVLACFVHLGDGPPLTRRLQTHDPRVARKRIRLLLWHAVRKGLLPGGERHEAWVEYGGRIPESVRRLLGRLAILPWSRYRLRRIAAAKSLGYLATTIDWLTDQDKAGRQDPVKRAHSEEYARRRDREKVGGKQTPKWTSWQFKAGGTMLSIRGAGRFYGQVMIAGVMLQWRLSAKNLEQARQLIHRAVLARKRVQDAAIEWGKCEKGSPEARQALKTVLGAQEQLRDALLAVGAKHSKRWAHAVQVLRDPPNDETTSRDLEKACTAWFVDLLLKNPWKPPRPLEETRDGPGLLKEAAARFNVSLRRARRCYELAQEKTGNRNWRSGGRPEKKAA
jgi:hypothetical protein